MKHPSPRLSLGVALVSLFTLVFSISITSASADSRYFATTGHTVTQPFLDYWDAHGGLAQQGYPITNNLQEVNTADCLPYRTQYFERSRFEFHPENKDPQYQVLLGLLGKEAFLARYPSGKVNAKSETVPGRGSQFFAATGHSVSGMFLDYWNTHGGLTQQGYPITDAYYETNAADGKPYITQYFERARFEYHPEQSDPQYQVLLGLVGKEVYALRHPNGGNVTPLNCQPNHQPTATPTSALPGPAPTGEPTHHPNPTATLPGPQPTSEPTHQGQATNTPTTPPLPTSEPTHQGQPTNTPGLPTPLPTGVPTNQPTNTLGLPTPLPTGVPTHAASPTLPPPPPTGQPTSQPTATATPHSLPTPNPTP